MKKVICLTLFLLVSSTSLAFMATLENQMWDSSASYVDSVTDRVLCPNCLKEGKRSKVHILYTSVTAMDCGGGYYDEDGFFQPVENCNTATTHYSCSNGHTFAIDK